MRHDIESCDQGGEDQDKTWLDGPVATRDSALSGKWNAYFLLCRMQILGG